MEPVSWLKAASDKLKKPDNRSRKEVYNRYFDNSQRLLRSVYVGFSIPPLPFPYQQTHALTCLFASPYPAYQRKAFTTTSLHLAYKKIVSAFVLVHALGFLRLNLTCPMGIPGLLYTRHCFGPGFGCARTVLTPCLTDAVMKGVKVRGRLHVSSCTARVVLV